MTIWMRLIAVVIGYVPGLISFGELFAKAKGVDLRSQGSGNTGATNTLRVLGNKLGFITLMCDALKAIVPAVVVYFIVRGAAGESVHLLMLYAAAGAVIGHIFPAHRGFKGGKGISSTLGLAIICFPQILPITAVVFLGTVFITRFVSLGSILGALSLLIQVIIMGQIGILFMPAENLIECYIVLAVVVFFDIFRHKDNIKRLLSGKENKFSLHHKNEK